MNGLPHFVHIEECAPRDGLQIERRILTVQEKVEIIEGCVAAGIKEIEIGSYVRADLVPQMATTHEVVEALKPSPAGVQYRARYLNVRGIDRAWAQRDKIAMEGRVAITASELFAKRNTGLDLAAGYADISKWMERYRELGLKTDTLGVMAAFGCNFEGDIPAAKAIAIIARSKEIIEEGGGTMNRLSLMDTMGWATPLRIRQLVGAVQERWPTTRINLHLHDTRGMATASAFAALEMGVADFDGSIGGLGGCPFAGHSGAAGNISTEDLIFMCHELGIETGIDLEALIEVARRAEVIMGKTLPGKVMRSGTFKKFRSCA